MHQTQALIFITAAKMILIINLVQMQSLHFNRAGTFKHQIGLLKQAKIAKESALEILSNGFPINILLECL